MQKAAFLQYLGEEFTNYYLITPQDGQRKAEQKCFLNGLMKASRFFDVTHDELKAVIDREYLRYQSQHPGKAAQDKLEEPTYRRLGLDIDIKR